MDASRRWRLIRFAITTVFLFVAWLFFSGGFGPLSLLAGLLGAGFVAFLSYDVFIEEHEVGRRSLFPRFVPAILYSVKLVIAMYAASGRVLFGLVSGRIEPRIVHFRSRLHSDLARVVLAHSITFTPGTITLDLDEDHYLVHWLFASTRHSSRAGEEVKGPFEASLKRIWS